MANLTAVIGWWSTHSGLLPSFIEYISSVSDLKLSWMLIKQVLLKKFHGCLVMCSVERPFENFWAVTSTSVSCAKTTNHAVKLNSEQWLTYFPLAGRSLLEGWNKVRSAVETQLDPSPKTLMAWNERCYEIQLAASPWMKKQVIYTEREPNRNFPSFS